MMHSHLDPVGLALYMVCMICYFVLAGFILEPRCRRQTIRLFELLSLVLLSGIFLTSFRYAFPAKLMKWYFYGIVFLLPLFYRGHRILKFALPFLYLTAGITVHDMFFFDYYGVLSMGNGNRMFETLAEIFVIALLFLLIFLFLYFNRSDLPSGIPDPAHSGLPSILFFVCDLAEVNITHYVLYNYSIENPRLSYACLTLSVIMITGTIAFLCLMEKVSRQDRLEQENELLSIRLAGEEEHLKHIRNENEIVRILRHDMKNYLLGYRALLNEGKYEQVRSDIDRLITEKLAPAKLIYTDNAFLDSLFLYYADKCSAGNIIFRVNCLVPDTFNDMDILVLLSNLLSNAYEYEAGQEDSDRAVYTDVLQMQDDLTVLVRNRIRGSVLKSNPDLKSTKPDNNLHGFGTRSVRNIVERKNGIMDIYEEDGMFCVHVIIPTCQQDLSV